MNTHSKKQRVHKQKHVVSVVQQREKHWDTHSKKRHVKHQKHAQDAEQQKAQHYNIIMFLMHKVIIFVQFAKNILLIYLVKTTS